MFGSTIMEKLSTGLARVRGLAQGGTHPSLAAKRREGHGVMPDLLARGKRAARGLVCRASVAGRVGAVPSPGSAVLAVRSSTPSCVFSEA